MPALAFSATRPLLWLRASKCRWTPGRLAAVVPRQRQQVQIGSQRRGVSFTAAASSSDAAGGYGLGTFLAGSRVPVPRNLRERQRGGGGGGVDADAAAARATLDALWTGAEKAGGVFAFASDATAVAAVVGGMREGECVLATKFLRGEVRALLEQACRARGVAVEYVATWDYATVAAAFEAAAAPGGRTRVKQLFVQTPVDPLMHASDLRALSALAHRHGAAVVVDNSLMSPVLMNPLRLGADVVLHVEASYLGGVTHGSSGISKPAVVAVRGRFDMMGKVGAAVAAEASLGAAHAMPGATLSHLDALLMVQEMRTLAVRVDAAQRNAQHVGRFLQSHPAVTKVHYLDAFLGVGSPNQRLQFSQVSRCG
jgi:cystathionine beta-lyase